MVVRMSCLTWFMTKLRFEVGLHLERVDRRKRSRFSAWADYPELDQVLLPPKASVEADPLTLGNAMSPHDLEHLLTRRRRSRWF